MNLAGGRASDAVEPEAPPQLETNPGWHTDPTQIPPSRSLLHSLLRTRDGTKSESLTKVVSPKVDVYVPQHKCNGGPWIMGPVMANCVRRSNALLGYSASLVYSETFLRGAGCGQIPSGPP